MSYIIIIFRSRNDALGFLNFLAKHGVTASVVNTPRQLSSSCGLSLKTYASRERILRLRREYPNANGIIGAYAADGFEGAKNYTLLF